MAYLRDIVTYNDSALDAFGRLSVAEPTTIFDAQFTYDLQPLLYEPIVSSGTVTITHDATNRNARLIHTASASGEIARFQSYEHFRYQPGKAQQLFITFNIGAFVANTYVRVGLYDQKTPTGFIFARETDNILYFKILSNTTAGTQSIAQSAWNIDRLDGTGTVNPSNKTLQKLRFLSLTFRHCMLVEFVLDLILMVLLFGAMRF
jgi:hypothetical protein